jgi:hypothetical protein
MKFGLNSELCSNFDKFFLYTHGALSFFKEIENGTFTQLVSFKFNKYLDKNCSTLAAFDQVLHLKLRLFKACKHYSISIVKGI